MRIITKWFDTLQEVEDYQDELYDKYDYVECYAVPMRESGYYSFKVK